MKERFLSKRQAKKIIELIEQQWGCRFGDDYVFLEKENKVYITKHEIEAVPFEHMRVNSIGLYLAEIKDSSIRLSIEGSQLIGPRAIRNVVELTSEETNRWVQGEDLEKDVDSAGFVIMRSGQDYLGCGKPKQGRILNFIPKSRRLNVQDPHQIRCCD